MHVLVIGMSEDPRIRLDFEDDLSAAITADGVKVTPGNHILLRPDSPVMDENYLKGQIRDFKVDGVLVSRLVSVDKKTSYTPGSSYTVPYGYYNNFYGYYGTVYRRFIRRIHDEKYDGASGNEFVFGGRRRRTGGWGIDLDRDE